ncbi:MAG: hypothetical protein OEY94_00155 [Alphaproteobacteria bacterium]|nr:hypothetical protein [Alphaproteobacteria bacterium]
MFANTQAPPEPERYYTPVIRFMRVTCACNPYAGFMDCTDYMDKPCNRQAVNDDNILKVFSINTLKKHNKIKITKMKRYEQTIGLRDENSLKRTSKLDRNFLKRENELYKPARWQESGLK